MDSSRTISAHVDSFAALSQIVAEGVLVLDSQATIRSVNPAAQRLLGYAPESLIGTPLEDLLHESNTGDAFSEQSTLVLRDTLDRALAVNSRYTEGILLFAPAGRVAEIEQLKNELVATVSHELKTPLAAIKAYTATLREHPQIYESHRDEFLGVIEEQADRLARVVDDMLTITRVESGHLLRRRVRVTAMRVVDEALLGISYNPALHPIAVDLGDVEVSGDPERLRDLFRNLIENAIKYSPQGGTIVLRGEQDAHSSSIVVQDNGCGIAAADLPYIYDRFFRGAAHEAGDVPGSGLGLYIASAIVRAHGGTIDVESTIGKGTAFTVKLPLR